MNKLLCLMVSAFLALTTTSLMADITVGGNGDVSPADPATSWTPATTAYIGYQNTSGGATLTIDGNGAAQGLSVDNLNIGYAASTMGQLNVTGLGAYMYVYEGNGALTIGYDGNGEVNMADNGLTSIYDTIIGRNAGSTGELNINNAIYSNNNAMYVGYTGGGSVDVSNGGSVYAGELHMNTYAGSTGSFKLAGENSYLEAVTLYVGQAAAGSATLEITDEAYAYTTELHIDAGNNGESFIGIATDGKLGFYDPDKNITNMATFLAAISGNAIRFWDGDEYVSYATLTEGVDYEVVEGTGMLEGYAVLTTGGNVPEPATLSLVALGAISLLRRRK